MSEKNTVRFQGGQVYRIIDRESLTDEEIQQQIDSLAAKEGHGQPVYINIPGFGHERQPEYDFVRPTTIFRAPTVPGVPGLALPGFKRGKVSEDQVRAVTNLVGEEAGAQTGAVVGGLLGTPLGPWGVTAGATIGSGLLGWQGRRAAEKFQETLGLPAEEDRPSAAGLIAQNAGFELLGRGVFDMLPAARRWFMRGGAPPDIMRENIRILNSLGHAPRLDLITRGGFVDYASIYNWAAKNPLARSKIDAAYGQSLSSMSDLFRGISDVPFAGRMRTPDTTTLGRSVERRLTKYDKAWHDKARVLYGDFERVFSPDTPIPASKTLETLGKLSSTENPLLDALTTPRLQNLRESITDVYGGTILGPDGEVVSSFAQVPFGKLKELRTRVGEVLGRVAPNPDLPKEELLKLYGALSKDLEAAAKAAGPEVYSKFKRANTYYHANMRMADTTLEKIYKKFGKAGGTPADISKAVESFVRGRDVVRLAHLKTALGADSAAWDHMQRYIFSEMMFPEEAGPASVIHFLRRAGKMSDPMRKVLFGKRGSSMRESMETVIEASRRMPGFGEAPLTPYSRFTQAETLGPLAAGSAVSGGALGMATGSVTGGLIAFAALAVASPKYITRLLLNEKSMKSLARGLSGRVVDVGALATRLAGQAASMNDADRIAVAKYLEALSTVASPLGVDQNLTQLGGE